MRIFKQFYALIYVQFSVLNLNQENVLLVKKNPFFTSSINSDLGFHKTQSVNPDFMKQSSY